MTILMFFSRVALILLASSGVGETLQQISLNSATIGSTSGAERDIFDKFSKKDFTEPTIGTGGQRIMELQVLPEQGTTALEISSCTGSDFDTYLALLDNNPVNSSQVSVLSESGSDIACLTGQRRAFISTRVKPGVYYLLVTGNGANEGAYNITVRGSVATPAPLPWGLDRIDQRKLPLDNQYSVRDSGENVWIYVVDSGIRASHEEFEGRAQEGYDFVNNERDSSMDCTGHGTHVAGIIAGKRFGVARKARIIAIKVFGCDNKAKSSRLIDAIGWILVDSKIKSRENVVVTLMFSTSDHESTILETTIKGLVRSGIPVIVPAGNHAANSCAFYPASVEEFLTVGATDILDDLSSFSNLGNCTNFFAPGSSIMSSWHTSDTSWRNLSGSAQAAAHMVGIVANLMALNSNMKATSVKTILESISTKGIVGKVPANESTRFGFVRSVPKFTGSPPPTSNVFLYTILGIPLSGCDENDERMVAMHQTMTKILSVKGSRLRVSCRSLQTKLADDDISEIELRVEIPERMAAVTFAMLEQALVSEKEETEKTVGYSFAVIELPWAVDSTPVVFWGAPSFAETESHSLSAGAIAGIVVGTFCLVAILSALFWVMYRKMTRVDEVESMEGSADMEKAPVHFDDFGNNNDVEAFPRSFRNVLKAMRGKSVNNSFYGQSATGLNKMGSFVGGPHSAAPKDLVRLSSFGGEAFAGLEDFSRHGSFQDALESDGRSSKNLALSFRGLNNLVLNRNRHAKGKQGEPDSDASMTYDSLRMDSLGGEAFARIGRDSSFNSGTETSTPRSEGDTCILENQQPRIGPGMRIDSIGTEALVSSSHVQRGSSFFGGTPDNTGNPA